MIFDHPAYYEKNITSEKLFYKIIDFFYAFSISVKCDDTLLEL